MLRKALDGRVASPFICSKLTQIRLLGRRLKSLGLEIRWLLTVTCQRVVVTSVSAVIFNPGHMKSDIRYVSWVTDNVHE